MQRRGWVGALLGWAVQKCTRLRETLLRNAYSASLGSEPGIPILRSLLFPPTKAILTPVAPRPSF